MTSTVTRLRQMTSKNWLGGMSDRIATAKAAAEKIEFALAWSEGIPRLADNPKCYVLSAEDIAAFRAALQS